LRAKLNLWISAKRAYVRMPYQSQQLKTGYKLHATAALTQGIGLLVSKGTEVG
jgi:hypothetical protein